MKIIVGAASWCCLLLALFRLSFAKAVKPPRYNVVRVLRGTTPIDKESIAASGDGGGGEDPPRTKRDETVPPPHSSLGSSGISHEAVDSSVSNDAEGEGGSMMIMGEYGKMDLSKSGKMFKDHSAHKKCKKAKSTKASQNESTKLTSETPPSHVPKGKSMTVTTETHPSSESIAAAASEDGSGGIDPPRTKNEEKVSPIDSPPGSSGISHEAVDKYVTDDVEGGARRVNTIDENTGEKVMPPKIMLNATTPKENIPRNHTIHLEKKKEEEEKDEHECDDDGDLQLDEKYDAWSSYENLAATNSSDIDPSDYPSSNPSEYLSYNPNSNPSGNPSESSSRNPSGNPSKSSSSNPSGNPSDNSRSNPSGNLSQNSRSNPRGNASENWSSNSNADFFDQFDGNGSLSGNAGTVSNGSNGSNGSTGTTDSTSKRLVIIISFAAFVAFVLVVVEYAFKRRVTLFLVEVVDMYDLHSKHASSELDNHDQHMSHQ